jgi:hypothetical protein
MVVEAVVDEVAVKIALKFLLRRKRRCNDETDLC